MRRQSRLNCIFLAAAVLSAAEWGCAASDPSADAGNTDAASDACADVCRPYDAADPGHDDSGTDAETDAGDAGTGDSGTKDSGLDAGRSCPPDCPQGEMTSIPAATFWMGCNEAVDIECGDNEKPYHEVKLSAYQIGKFEVTVYEYAKCVADKGHCAEPGTGNGCNWGLPGREWHPVNCVDLVSARIYCSWAGLRLPTEAEWENAARGSDGRRFPWGNSPGVDCNRAVCEDGAAGGKGCGAGGTMPIGSKTAGASPYGLLDMIGNVREWVNDYYDKAYYASSPSENPTGPKYGINGVQRGGSWGNFGSYNARTSNRLPEDLGNAEPYVGFRCAK